MPSCPSTQFVDPFSVHIDANVVWSSRSRVYAGLLGMLLGAFGVHRFYLGYRRIGGIQIAVTILTGGIGGLWGICEGWSILCGSFGFDASGRRLCHQTAMHVVVALIGAGLFHAGAIAALTYLDQTMVRLFPPPTGIDSIQITASMATSGSTPAVDFPMETSSSTAPNVDRDAAPIEMPPVEKQSVTSTLNRTPQHELAAMTQAGSVTLVPLQELPRRRDQQRPHGLEPSRSIKRAEHFLPLAPQTNARASIQRVPETSSTRQLVTLRLVRNAAGLTPSKREAASYLDARRTDVDSELRQVDAAGLVRAETVPSEPTLSKPNQTVHRSLARADPSPRQPATETSASTAASSVSMREQRGVQTDALPAKMFSPKPDYPTELRNQRVEGLVKLRVHVGPDGRVTRASIHRTSGFREFDQAALDVIGRWRFEPARRAGIPVEMEIAVPVRFVIGD